MVEFIDNIHLLVSAPGYKVFERIVDVFEIYEINVGSDIYDNVMKEKVLAA